VYTTTASTPRIVLRNLPLAGRLTLALFLISTGIGYVSALVQLHFQHASPGSPLPTPDDAVRIFHGQTGKPVSQIERLLKTDEKEKFNGTGSMAAAFTTKSSDWKKQIKELVKIRSPASGGEDVAAVAEAELRKERDGERQAVLAWIEAGAPKAEYEKDAFPLPKSRSDVAVSADYTTTCEGGLPAAKIKSILTDRCARCHTATSPDDANAGNFPLETYEQLKPRVTGIATSAMSLSKLAQTTHVHLLGFSMLYGLTGLILAFSSYPATLRVILCPLPLLGQVVEISFWWLARLPEPLGPEIARLIAITGALVAVGVLLHIVLGLFDLFGGKGKLVLALLLGSAVAGGVLLHRTGVIEGYLNQERTGVEEAAK
jgi:hypothetical protein